MGAVKHWLMAMEEAAHAAIHDGLNEKDALEYMGTVMKSAGQPATPNTLKEVYNNVQNSPDDLSP
jgi:hypothetical protein